MTNATSITACVCGLNSALVELNDDSSRCECNAGYGGDASIVSVGCSPCGTYHYKSNTGNTQCTQCPPGSMIGEGVTNGTSSSLCGCGLNAEMSTETGRCECSAGYGGDATVAGVGCSPCGSTRKTEATPNALHVPWAQQLQITFKIPRMALIVCVL